MVERCLEYSKENPLAQAIPHCATLKNHLKNSALGIEFYDPDLRPHHCVILGMTKLPEDGSDSAVAALTKEVTKKGTGCKYTAIAHSTITDYAAPNVCDEMEHEREGCDMHQIDKIGQAAIRSLVRKDKKKVVNPFPEGQKLFAKMRANAIHFFYGTHIAELQK